MTTTDRLVAALAPRNKETRTAVHTAARRLAADLTADHFDLIVEAVEHPTGVGSPDMVKEAGITYRQLDYWTREGYLIAEIDAPGQGHHRIYPRGQLSKAILLHRLVNLLGMRPLQASYAADELLAKGHARVPGLELRGDSPMSRITDRLLVQRVDDYIVFMDTASGEEVTFPIEVVGNVVFALTYLALVDDTDDGRNREDARTSQ